MIATPGAEPKGVGADYAAALLLDGWALLGRLGGAGEEALRRWLAAAALVRPDGTVLVHADSALAATQALIRWDPVTFAERELAERAELGFPPAVRMAAATGEAAAVASLLAGTDPAFEVLGPVPVEHGAAARDRGSGPRPDPGVQGAGRGPGPGAAGGAGGPQRPQGGRRRPGPARSGGADLVAPIESVVNTRLLFRDSGLAPSRREPQLLKGDIKLFGDPVLRRRPSRWSTSTSSCATWSRPHRDHARAPGVGLAAPQIGVGLRVFTYHVDDEPGHLINPVLNSRTRTRRTPRAACRSPGCSSPPGASRASSRRASTCTATR